MRAAPVVAVGESTLSPVALGALGVTGVAGFRVRCITALGAPILPMVCSELPPKSWRVGLGCVG